MKPKRRKTPRDLEVDNRRHNLAMHGGSLSRDGATGWLRLMFAGQADLSPQLKRSQVVCRFSRVAHSSHIPTSKEPLG
jgi:hypothetical protein